MLELGHSVAEEYKIVSRSCFQSKLGGNRDNMCKDVWSWWRLSELLSGKEYFGNFMSYFHFGEIKVHRYCNRTLNETYLMTVTTQTFVWTSIYSAG